MELSALFTQLYRTMSAKMYVSFYDRRKRGWSPRVVLPQYSGYIEKNVRKKQFSALLRYSRHLICDMFLQDIKVTLYLNKPNIPRSTMYINAY